MATRKKGVDLLGLGHPLIDALISHYRSETVSGDVLLGSCDGMAPNLAARYLFAISFADGAKREVYETLVLEGSPVSGDLGSLRRNGWQTGVPISLPDLEEKLKTLAGDQESRIRAAHDGVNRVRARCVGIQAIRSLISNEEKMTGRQEKNKEE